MSAITISWIIGGILALIGAAVSKYLAYRYGRKVQEGVYKDAEIKKGDIEKKALGKLARPDATNDDELLTRLSGDKRRKPRSRTRN